jgi:hypothetical protein
MSVPAPVLKNLEKVPPEEVVRSFAWLEKLPYSTAKKDENHPVFRVRQYNGFAGPTTGTPSFFSVKDDDPEAEIVVLDDAGNGFRSAETVWPAALQKGNQPIVLIKMGRPIAQGALWEAVRENHAERMIVVINADDLRQAGVQMSRRLSWERTAQDFVWQMACNSDLIALNNCAYLIVRFGADGARLHTRRGGVVGSRLFFSTCSPGCGNCA